MVTNKYILYERLPAYSPANTEISIQNYGILQPFRQWSHTHDYYEFFLVEDGNALHEVNTRTFRIGRGTLCFIRPSDTHTFLTYRSDHYKMYNVVMSADFFAQVNGFIKGSASALTEPEMPPTIRLDESRLTWYTALLNRIDAEDPSAARETMVRSLFVNVFCDLLFGKRSVRTLPAWLHELLSLLEENEHLMAPFQETVARFGVSREYVSRAFRKYLGITPSQYMNELRVRKAASMIEDGEDDLMSLCFDCGFNYYNYFCKQFKEYFHITPSEYREQCRKTGEKLTE